MDRENIYNALKQSFKDMTLEQFVRLFTNEVQIIEDFYKLCHDVDTGKSLSALSLLFNPHRFAIGTNKESMSIYESLQDDSKLSGLARMYLYNLGVGETKAFYHALQRGYNGIQCVQEFPPMVVRKILLQYGQGKENLRVLDPCAGWGARMIGAASIPGTTYVAFEPSTKTYEGLNKLGEWLKTLQPSFNYRVYCLPYEDKELNEHFDIALTSPPYYDTESYSTEETNSMNRYSDYEKWVAGFYAPLITSTVDLADMFILNVGDRQYPLSESLMKVCEDNGIHCERIHDYLMGYGEGKEKFYCLSKSVVIHKTQKLF